MIDTIINFVIESRLPQGGMTAFGPSSKKLNPGSPLLPIRNTQNGHMRQSQGRQGLTLQSVPDHPVTPGSQVSDIGLGQGE